MRFESHCTSQWCIARFGPLRCQCAHCQTPFPLTPFRTSDVAVFSMYRANGRGGFGSKTAADPPPPEPQKSSEKQTGVLGQHLTKCPSCKHFRVLSMRHCKERERETAWAKEWLFGHLQQSVQQNGRVHSHILDFCLIYVDLFCVIAFVVLLLVRSGAVALVLVLVIIRARHRKKKRKAKREFGRLSARARFIQKNTSSFK